MHKINIFSLNPLRTKSFTTSIYLRYLVRTCGLPEITSVMRNLTVYPGDEARWIKTNWHHNHCHNQHHHHPNHPLQRFECTVDMQCLVSYIQWFHTTPDNGTLLSWYICLKIWTWCLENQAIELYSSQFWATLLSGTRLLLRTGSSVGNPYSFSVTSGFLKTTYFARSILFHSTIWSDM